jgi:hypothetical protein
MTVAAVFAGGALLVGLPDAGDAGRLLGTAIGVFVLVNHDVFALAVSTRARVILVATAAVAFGAAWWVMDLVLNAAQPSSISALRLAASTLPSAAVLIAPAMLPRRLIAETAATRASRGSAEPP